MSASKKTNQNNRFWQKHLSQWQNSGLSQTEYCRQHDLHPDNFSYHKCKSIKNTTPSQSKGFIKVQLPTPKPEAEPLTLRFRNGTCLTGLTEDSLPLVKQIAEILA